MYYVILLILINTYKLRYINIKISFLFILLYILLFNIIIDIINKKEIKIDILYISVKMSLQIIALMVLIL